MTEALQSPRAGRGVSLLGTNAKLRAAGGMALRVERFALQAVARDILPKTRTALCLRARIKGSEGVGVWKCEKHGTAHYSGLQTCGSV